MYLQFVCGSINCKAVGDFTIPVMSEVWPNTTPKEQNNTSGAKL